MQGTSKIQHAAAGFGPGHDYQGRKAMKFKSVAAAAVAFAFLGFSAPALQAQTGTVKIGLNESMSGNFVAVGLPPAISVRMAVKEINDKGGFVVAGTTYKIQLVEVDNQSATASAVAGMTRLVEDDKVNFVFGPTLSTLATQSAQISVPAKVIHISAATSWQANGSLSDPAKPLLFGTQNPVNRIADIDAESMAQMGIKKIAFISQDDEVTKAVMPSFMASMKAANISVATVLFPPGTTDYTSYVSRAKGEDVDGVYFNHPMAVVNEVLRTVVQLGAGPKGFGGRNLNPNAPLKTAIGGPIPIPFFSTQATPSFEYPGNAKVKAFTERIKAFAPEIVGANTTFSFFTYDVVYMLVEAMKQAGTVTDTAKIGSALGNLSYDGVVGRICFGKTVRTTSLDGGVIVVRDGKLDSKVSPSTCK
jgi:branched-chain amino acid transport system substrate-binding protein